MRVALLALAALTSAAACAQNDAEYTKKILEYTTEPFFRTELVDHLPASRTVPTPQKVLGYVIGTPNVLTHVEDVNRYMRALEKASPRVRVQSMGLSEEGREMILVMISDEGNLRRMQRLKEITTQLGDPRKIDDKQADRLIAEGLPLYWATGAMHSPEAGSPEMLMELAYRLAVEETPFIKEIRKNSVVMLTPVLETDGRDRYVDTYLYRKANPDKPAIPLVYWGKYVAHDNNRDGMALSLAMSRNLMKTWMEFRPQVLHDLHESVPFLYISTGTGPYNAWLDPITIDEWHIMAYHEIDEMTKRGVPGVWTHGFYDGWAPNYAFYAANGHNAIGRFYETYGGTGADTGIRNVGSQSERDWFRPNPPFASVNWSIRNNVNMQQSALLLGLHHVASEKEKFLRNYYLKAKRSVAKARTEGPAAYVLPSDETRLGQQTALLKMLLAQGVELHRTAEAIDTKDGKFPAGSWVVRMDQPYSRMADMLLDKQYFNTNDPRPYDDTGWTLGPLFNVAVLRVKDTAILDAKMTEASPTFEVGSTSRIAIHNRGDFSLAQLLYANPSVEFKVALEAFKVGDEAFAAGDLISDGDGAVHYDARTAAAALGKEPPTVKTRAAERARIAIVHTWTSTQDEGWFRLAFDALGIPFKYISVHEIRDNANLREKFDVLILAPTSGSAQRIVNGIDREGEPISLKPLEGFPHLGGPDQTDNIRGGIELEGMVNLKRFLEAGGLLVCIGDTCRVPIDYGLVSGVSVVEPIQLMAPGGVFLVDRVSKASPVLNGYGDSFGAYFDGSPLLSVGGSQGGPRGAGAATGRASGRGDGKGDGDIVQGRASYTPKRDEGAPPAAQRGRPTGTPPEVLLRFAPVEKVLVSGGLAHGEELAGKAALVRCSVGRGNVLLFATNPMWRMQTHGSYQLLFNAAMNFRDLVPPKPKPQEKKEGG